MAKTMKKSWLVRCMDAKVAGRFSNRDIWDASSWDRCAVGEHRKTYGAKVIPYMKPSTTGMVRLPLYPKDKEMRTLGSEFYAAVRCNKPIVAMELLEQIDDRTLELKRNK